MNMSRDIDGQKTLYKNGTMSLCLKCKNYNEDCFDVMKFCDRDAKTSLSTVTRCASLNKKIVIEYKENNISVEAPQDSRVDNMGGGFQNIDKYKVDDNRR